MTARMLRKTEVCALIGEGDSTLKNRIRKGLFTPGVALSKTLKVWPSLEVETINAARIAGKSQDEIRALVAVLMAERTNALASLGR